MKAQNPGLTDAALDRRRALALCGGVGAAVLLGGSVGTPETVEAASCVLAAPAVTEGPYWVEEKLFRSDIRTDPTTGVARPGIRLTLTISLQNLSSGSCVPLAGAWVDVWHCDALGIYSDEPAYNPGGGTGTVVTKGQKFLRGYQISDDNGQVAFTTIYPGWYTGRTVHIHVRVRTYSGTTKLDEWVTQIFFSESDNNVVLAQAPYNTRTSARDTSNQTDNVYATAPNADRMMAVTTHTPAGYTSDITLGLNLRNTPATLPAVSSGGVVNAASGSAAFTPGSWIAIYGSNLAATTRTLAGSDVVNHQLPTNLGGVSVQVNGKTAYLLYVSPTQINALAPSDTATGTVPVTVTNASGTSAATTALMQAFVPGFFVFSGHVRAVRVSDGAIVNGTGNAESGPVTAAARPGDVLELFGTGFGPVTGDIQAGTVFQGAYPTANVVSVTIGGVPAHVSFAGLAGAGLYQINLTVPEGLAAGDHPVIATTGGVSTSSTALLKTS